MYNSKGPTSKTNFKPDKLSVKKDRAYDKKNKIKQGSKKDKKIDTAKFGKEV